MKTQIKINELKGTTLKNDLGLLRAIKRYQNKHVDKSGNFGFTLVLEKDKNEVWFTLDGDYNTNQEITHLNLSFFGSYKTEHEKEYNKLSLYFQDILKNGYQKAKKEESKKEIKNTPEQEEILRELKDFSGSLEYHKSTFGKLNLTDGINFLRNRVNCFWLIDIVESVQHLKSIQQNKEFILWKVEVKNGSFIVTARADTNAPILYEQKGAYTDFPLKEFEFYQVDKVLLLKSEY